MQFDTQVGVSPETYDRHLEKPGDMAECRNRLLTFVVVF